MDIGHKKYYELETNEVKEFNEALDNLNASQEQRNKIFIRLLFDMTLKEAVNGI